MLRSGELHDALTSSAAQSNMDCNSKNQCAVKSEPMGNADTCKLHVDKAIVTGVKQESSSSNTTANSIFN